MSLAPDSGALKERSRFTCYRCYRQCVCVCVCWCEFYQDSVGASPPSATPRQWRCRAHKIVVATARGLSDRQTDRAETARRTLRSRTCLLALLTPLAPLTPAQRRLPPSGSSFLSNKTFQSYHFIIIFFKLIYCMGKYFKRVRWNWGDFA